MGRNGGTDQPAKKNDFWLSLGWSCPARPAKWGLFRRVWDLLWGMVVSHFCHWYIVLALCPSALMWCEVAQNSAHLEFTCQWKLFYQAFYKTLSFTASASWLLTWQHLMVPTCKGLRSSVWKGTKDEFHITTWFVAYVGKLACISSFSENSWGLSHAYTTDFCQQSCAGQKAWRGVFPEWDSYAVTACICWESRPFSSL